MRQFLKDDSNRKMIHGSNSKQLKHRSIEVVQMLSFISEIEELWLGLVEGKQGSSLRFARKGDGISQGKLDNIPPELSSRLTHLITQVSVYFQLNADKPDFRLPTRKVSQVARIAKQIVIQDKLNIPRQTRSQFTLTVLAMLKASQEFFTKHKEERGTQRQLDNHSAQSVSDYTSIASSSMVSQTELAKELQRHAENLKKPDATIAKKAEISTQKKQTSVVKKKHSLGSNLTRSLTSKAKGQINRSTSHQKFMS